MAAVVSGDVTVGTCGAGIPLVDSEATAMLFSVVFAAVEAGD